MKRRARRVYTDKMIDFLTVNVDQYTYKDLTKAFNIEFKCNQTQSAIDNFIRQNKIKKENTTRKRVRRVYTDKMIAFLKSNAGKYALIELTKLFNEEFKCSKTTRAIERFLYQNKLKEHSSFTLTEEMINFLRHNFEDFSHTELARRFNAKFNLTKTRSNIATYCFKCGLKKRDVFPVGAERFRATQGGFIFVKVNNNEWKAKHRLVWEQHNGPIPKGHYVVFIDRNIENCNIENLALVTAEELIYLSHNGLLHSNEELTRIGINITKISLKVRKYNKNKEKIQHKKKRRTLRKFDEYLYKKQSN